MVVLATYLLFCAFVGYLGRRRSIGFAGFFLGAILLSPLIAALILLVTESKHKCS